MKCSERGRTGSRRRRCRPLGPPETASRILYAEVPRSQIALYRFLLEGYDNLAIMSVVDRYRAVIKLRFLSDAEQTVRRLLTVQGARIIERPGQPLRRETPDHAVKN